MREINVTKQAKKVFGDRVIKRAYIIDEYDDVDKDSIKFSDIDTKELIIEFNGGNIVRFYASEWLSITSYQKGGKE